MSMPNIPDINPKIDIKFEEVINILLASVALEEISLSHIMNAEAEKLQCIIDKVCDSKCKDIDDLFEINESVNRSLRDVIKKEILLQFKLENILDLIDKGKKNHHHCKTADD